MSKLHTWVCLSSKLIKLDHFGFHWHIAWVVKPHNIASNFRNKSNGNGILESCNTHWNFKSQFPNPRFSIKSTGATWVLKFQSQFIIQKQNKRFWMCCKLHNSMHYATIKPLTSKNIRQKNKQTKDWKFTSTLCCLSLFKYKAPMAATNCWLENKRWHPIEISQNWSSKKATTMCKKLMNKEELVTRRWWLVISILQNQANYLENALIIFWNTSILYQKISRSNQEWPKFNYVV